MIERLSKTQIDKLGERLKSAQPSDSDLQELDEYRRSFGEPYETVVSAIRDRLELEATGRPAKTIPSVREKLRRESIRLTQIQDIAGCRLVVPGIAEQNNVVARLCDLFPNARVIDRRAAPSHGYRAVHVIPTIEGKHVEIQVRTTMQHRWAEVSEKCFDVDPDIKYGGGKRNTRDLLLKMSDSVYESELLEELSQQALQIEMPQNKESQQTEHGLGPLTARVRERT